MKKILVRISTVIMILIMATSSVSAKVPLNLREGDEFTFELSKFGVSTIVNGTEYAPDATLDTGSEIKVAVTNIDDVDTSSGSFFGASNTYVNYTETVDGDKTDTSSYVDSWQDQFLGFLFISALLLAFSGYPNSFDFSEPILDTSTSADTQESGLPYFATSNVTFYKDLSQTYEDLDDNVADTPGASASVDARLDDKQETFTVEYTLSITNTTTNVNGNDASLSLDYTFETTVDLTRSVLTHFLLDASLKVKIGNADSSYAANYGFDEKSGGFLDNIRGAVPGPSFAIAIFAIISLGILPILRNRKR